MDGTLRCLCVLSLAVLPQRTFGQTFEDALNIYKDKTGHLPPHFVDVRPVLNQSKVVSVKVGFWPVAVVDVSEVSQSFTCNGFITLKWTDEILAWDKAQAGNVTKINPKPAEIWRPRFTLINTLGDRDPFKDDISPLTVKSDGRVMWEPGGVFVTSCGLVLTKYPFDTQVCIIKFGVMNYYQSEVVLIPDENIENDKPIFKNGQWAVKAVKVSNLTDLQNGNESSHIMVIFTLVRMPNFYLLVIILPIVIISFLNLFVFFIPVETGEKVSAGITVLLSQAMFMSSLSEMLPRSSNSLPLLTIYLFVLIANAALIVLLTIVVAFLHGREKKLKRKTSQLSKDWTYQSEVDKPPRPEKLPMSGFVDAPNVKLKVRSPSRSPDAVLGDNGPPREKAPAKCLTPRDDCCWDLSGLVNMISFVVTFCLWTVATVTFVALVM